jgi:hypothetical protein
LHDAETAIGEFDGAVLCSRPARRMAEKEGRTGKLSIARSCREIIQHLLQIRRAQTTLEEDERLVPLAVGTGVLNWNTAASRPLAKAKHSTLRRSFLMGSSLHE